MADKREDIGKGDEAARYEGLVPSVPILGVPVCPTDSAGAVSAIQCAIDHDQRMLIGVVNAAKLVNMSRDETLRDAVMASDVIFADGMSVVWAGRVLGHRIRERVTGIDLMMDMLALADRRNLRVYLFGAKEEVNQRVAEIIQSRYPGTILCGRRNGYYEHDEESEIVGEIRDARPHMLFVAMSPPKKEIFLAKYRDQLGASVMHGVGGAFDVLAGKTKRAPMFWQKWGLEWLYRVVQEPRRMWRRYLVTNTLFFFMLLRDVLSPRPLYHSRSKPRTAFS